MNSWLPWNQQPSRSCSLSDGGEKEATSAPAIHRLPSEILFLIFDHARTCPGQPPLPTPHSRVRESGSSWPLPDHRTLVTVIHVCKRWRAVALASPPLWANIVARTSSALIFGGRASVLPLTVHAETVGKELSPVQTRALWRLKPRIRTLVLRLQCRLELKAYRSILAALAGTLEYLVVLIGRSLSAPSEEFVNFRLSSQDWTFFDGVTPTALKSLLIESYVPLVPADICPNLRSFTLRTRLHLWPPYSSPLPPLVRFLSHTPLL